MNSEEFGKILDDIYDKYENKIQITIQRARQSNNYATVKFNNALSSRLGGILDGFENEFLSALNKHIKVVAREQVDRFYGDVGKKAGVVNTRKTALDSAKAYFNEKSFYVQNQVNKMKYDIKTALKYDQLLITRHSLLNGMSRKAALKEVREIISSNTVTTTFTNKNGARYNSRTYFEMLGRTVISQFGNQVYEDALIEAGVDLAMISSHGATDRCRKWEGKVVSLTGATEGYPTLAQSRESGDIWHPRCKHFLIPIGDEDGI